MDNSLAGEYTASADEVTLYLEDGWSVWLARDDDGAFALTVVGPTIGAHIFTVTGDQAEAVRALIGTSD